nr:protein ACCELERATED CELL DEATH 6-like [Ipomoea batatas]
MAGSSSQPELGDNIKKEPGPLMKLILQAGRDKSAPSQGLMEPVEKKEPEKDLNWYLPLYKAALRGDWDSAKNFFNQDPEAITAKITKVSETALHIAVGTQRATSFVKELLELIPKEALVTLKDQAGQTALHYAAIYGNVKAAELLVTKSPELTNVWSGSGLLPIHLAAGYANKDMISYLLTVTRDDVEPSPFADRSGVELLNLVISAEFYDLALYLIQLYPKLATLRSPAGNTALRVIAGKPSAFPSGIRLNVWQRLIYSCIPVKFGNVYSPAKIGDMENPAAGNQSSMLICRWVHFFREFGSSGCKKCHEATWEFIEWLVPYFKSVRDTRLMHRQTLQLIKRLCAEVAGLDYSSAASIFDGPILLAAVSGISELVEEILESFPPAIWSRNQEGHNIFLLAVENRRENIFNILYQMSEHKQLATQLRDVKRNNILHLAGKRAPPARLSLVSGAALQMQRELQWYKEVEKYVLPDSKDARNSNGRTPSVEFSVEHKDLVKEGEKWMKDTANSCTVSATLIATIGFAASITVPGGNNSDSGFPIFHKNSAFTIFAIFDALSLFSSTASLLMFLSILTARYAENDFLYSLPRRLIIGLTMLFLSITSMMVAFSATIYLVFGEKKAWTLVPVAGLACLPVTLFVTLQYPLLKDMITSTYCPGIFGKRSDRLLF